MPGSKTSSAQLLDSGGPFESLLAAYAPRQEQLQLADAMAEFGNPNSVSDAGVGVLALHACIEGAWLNVKINSAGLKDQAQLKEILEEGEILLQKSAEIKDSIHNIVLSRIK